MGQTIAAEIGFSQGEIDVLAKVLSALDGSGDLRVVHEDGLSLTEDEDRNFVRARSKIAWLAK